MWLGPDAPSSCNLAFALPDWLTLGSFRKARRQNSTCQLWWLQQEKTFSQTSADLTGEKADVLSARRSVALAASWLAFPSLRRCKMPCEPCTAILIVLFFGHRTFLQGILVITGKASTSEPGTGHWVVQLPDTDRPFGLDLSPKLSLEAICEARDFGIPTHNENVGDHRSLNKWRKLGQ